MVEMRGEDAGALIASGRLAVIDEPRSTASATSRAGCAMPCATPAAGFARSRTCGARSCSWLAARPSAASRRRACARSSPRRRARAALPDSPLELALAARYLGIGDPFALARDELASAREVVAPASRLLHLYRSATQLRALFRRGEIDLALGNPATLGDQRAGVVAVLPSEGTIATERVLGVVSGSPRAGCARRLAGALLAPPAQAQLSLVRGLLPVRSATCVMLSETACKTVQRALAHAREQRRGRPSDRRPRASRAGRNGWGSGCSCGGDRPSP